MSIDELRLAIGLRKYIGQAGRKRLRPGSGVGALWTRGPMAILEALHGLEARSLESAAYESTARGVDLAVRAQLASMHAVLLAEGGLLPTARALAAERGGGTAELKPADLEAAVARVCLPPGATVAVPLDRLAAAASVVAHLLVEARADEPARQVC